MSATPGQDKEHREEAGFFSRVGMTASIWGIGIALLLVRQSAAHALAPLALLLTPVAMGSLYFALFAAHPGKREDASHIHVISLTGTLACLGLPDPALSYYALAAVMVLMGLRNRLHALEIAPNGPAFFLASFMLPMPADGWSVMALVVVALAASTHLGRREKRVANTAFAFGATLHISFQLATVAPTVTAVLALIHLVLVYYLQYARFAGSAMPFERRLYLDDVAAMFAFTLFLKAATALDTGVRYAWAAVVFCVVALLTSNCIGVLREMSRLPVLGDSLARAAVSLQHRSIDLRRNSAAVTAALAAEIAIYSLVLPGDQILLVTLQTAMALIVALMLLWFALAIGSQLARDASKLTSTFAAIMALMGLVSSSYGSSPWYFALALALVQFIAIAQTIHNSSGDLNRIQPGAWQGVFAGRALVRIRRTRGRVFELITKAPMIGWLFHFGDRAVSSLQTAFGSSKTWTASHYTICVCAGIGFLATIRILFELLTVRFPIAGAAIFGLGGAPGDMQFRNSMIQVLSVVLYGSVLFAIGSWFRMKYLRTIAVALTGFLTLAFWFYKITQDKNSISAWVFPLAFCCSMALFRMFFRHKPSER